MIISPTEAEGKKERKRKQVKEKMEGKRGWREAEKEGRRKAKMT